MWEISRTEGPFSPYPSFSQVFCKWLRRSVHHTHTRPANKYCSRFTDDLHARESIYYLPRLRRNTWESFLPIYFRTDSLTILSGKATMKLITVPFLNLFGL